MSDNPVRYELSDNIATITIDRPEAMNSLSRAVREGLWSAFRRFVDEDAALVAILTATGDKAFCAGGDLKEISACQHGVRIPIFINLKMKKKRAAPSECRPLILDSTKRALVPY
mgnify:CR=1 FL=1